MKYWIVDAYQKSLECLFLCQGAYVIDAAGKNADVLSPASLPGLVFLLAELWAKR